MDFESRSLTPYAEPVQPSQLITGNTYFFLNYSDFDLLIPNLEPVVFIGRNLSPDETERVYFQDFDSYQEGIRYEFAGSETMTIFSTGSEHEVNHVFVF